MFPAVTFAMFAGLFLFTLLSPGIEIWKVYGAPIQ